MSRFLFYDDKIVNILLKEEKPSGGAAVQAYCWIKGLSEAGQDIHVLTAPVNKGMLKEDCRNIQLLSLYDSRKGMRWLRWVYYRLPFIYRQIKNNRPDFLYHGTPCWQSFLLGILCRMLGVKYILRVSNDYLVDERIYKNRSRTYALLMRWGMKLAYCILCQNSYQFGQVSKVFPRKRILLIPNPFFYREVKRSILPESSYIAWIGLFQHQKNLPLLFEIAATLQKERFLIAGKEGTNCDAATKHYLEKLAALPNVQFVGFLERAQVFSFLSNAKYLLNTSHYEGFSNTFLEAMSVGTPIITSSKVNPDSIIDQYGLGLVYDSVHDLQIKFAQVTPESHQQMSERVLQYVAHQHDYRVLSQRLMRFLNEEKEETSVKPTNTNAS